MAQNVTESGNMDNSSDPYTWMSRYDSMSDTGGGISVGLVAGAGIGGCAVVVGVIALVIYCYMKARKKNSNTNMTKSNDVFSTNMSMNYPQRSRVNQYPDPAAARKAREREKARDAGHVNAAYSRHASDSSSVSSTDGRDFSPPRVRRPRGGHENRAYSSDSSYDDSSSVDEDPVMGGNYTMERETEDRSKRSSYKRARQHDVIDGERSKENGTYRRTNEESHRRSRRDDFSKRNPRSDSPLTIETLGKHDKITSQDTDKKWDSSSRKERTRRRESSPSRTLDSSEVTGTSLVTEATGTTASSRFTKNPSLRRNSPSRSSSHRRYRKENEKDSTGRRKPRRTRSSDRGDRSRSPGSSSSRSGGSQRSSSRRSRSSSEAKKINKDQAMLPIFANPGKKSSAV